MEIKEEEKETMTRHKFKYMSSIISKLAYRLHRRIGLLYDKSWNLANYAIVCGIGVLINMSILLPVSKIFPLWLANLFAILTAWMWNWSMSVGPFGWLWGFRER
jgi:hypothetical protein